MSAGTQHWRGALGQLFCSAANSTLYLETFRHWLLLRPRGDADEWIACTLQEKITVNAYEPYNQYARTLCPMAIKLLRQEPFHSPASPQPPLQEPIEV